MICQARLAQRLPYEARHIDRAYATLAKYADFGRGCRCDRFDPQRGVHRRWGDVATAGARRVVELSPRPGQGQQGRARTL